MYAFSYPKMMTLLGYWVQNKVNWYVLLLYNVKITVLIVQKMLDIFTAVLKKNKSHLSVNILVGHIVSTSIGPLTMII